MEIQDLSWERAHLFIGIPADSDPQGFTLVAGEKTIALGAFFDAETQQIVLPLYRAYQEQALPAGQWALQYQEKICQISAASLGRQHSQVFWYGRHSNYALVVELQSNYERELRLSCKYMMANNSGKEHLCAEPKKLSYLATRVAKTAIGGLYRCFQACNRQESVLFLSQTKNTLSNNLTPLKDQVESAGNQQILCVTSDDLSGKNSVSSWLQKITAISKSKVIFIDDYAPIFNYINLKNTQLVQIWHAGVGFKSLGYARFGREGSPYPNVSSHRKYDHVIVASPQLIDTYSEVFALPKSKFLAYGLPRLDTFMLPARRRQAQEQFYAAYPQAQGKEVILFAPTFRGRGEDDAFYDSEQIDQQRLYDLCGENRLFFIKMHPFVSQSIQIEEQYRDRLIEVADGMDILDLFHVTDLLITDYSSCFYEFTLLEKPIIFYAYDEDEYAMVHGMQDSLADFAPGKICRDSDQLVAAIENQDFEIEKMKAFKRKYFSGYSFNACAAIVEKFL